MEKFKKATMIIESLQKNGHDAYFVGGCVRDFVLNRSVNDIDIATSASPKEVMELFNKTIPVGLAHGTVLVLVDKEGYEVTTFRTEGEYEDFRHPSEVQFVKRVELDLTRRDFTMNALAMDQTFHIIDLFDGVSDIKNGQIRAVGNPDTRFREDALRMIRAFRFCSQLGFKLEKETKRALYDLVPLLSKISIERVTAEFEKLISGSFVSSVWGELYQSGILNHTPFKLYPLSRLNTIHKYDFTKLEGVEEKWAFILFILGEEDPYQALGEWKLSNHKRKGISKLVKGLIQYNNQPLTLWDIYNIGIDAAQSIYRIQSVWKNECFKEKNEEILNMFHLLPIKTRQEIVVNGEEIIKILSRVPGPWLGTCIENLEKEIVIGNVSNDSNSIKEWLEQWKQK